MAGWFVQNGPSKAGIQGFRSHDPGHTFASHPVTAGVDITTVKELLGHKNLTITLIYAHLTLGHKVKAVRVLAGLETQGVVYNLFTVGDEG